MNHRRATGVTNVMKTIMILLALIGILVALRRTLTLAGAIPSLNPPGGEMPDASFAQHKAALLVHILPGLMFMILGPMQFMSRLRKKHPVFHRWNGRVYLIAAYTVGISALILPFLFQPIGGMVEATASFLFGLYFLIALTMAWLQILQQNIVEHRKWMIRAFSIGLAVATIRPIVGLFFAFSGLQPREFFGIAFWIGFTLHAIAAELWIRAGTSSASIARQSPGIS
jgi:uncharacterized membrane protein